MKHRFRSVAIALGALCAAGFLLWLITDTEPKYQGKRLTRWLDDINSAGSLSNAEPALHAIREMGTNSLPFLVAILRHQESAARQRAIELTENANLHRIGVVFRRSRKSPACLALKTLGTNAAPIVPALGEMALDPQLSGWAISALFSIGQPAVPGFEKACESSYLSTRATAATYLGKVIDGSQRGWSWRWSPTGPRGRAIFEVGAGYGGEQDALALGQLLQHPNPAVRRASADALRTHSRSAKVALKQLRVAQTDPDESVRIAAQDAIAAVEAASDTAK